MTVYLVGAGPGDPELITVRGAAALARADVVVYDRLASPSLLDLAPRGAELISAAKAPGAVALTQDEINAVLVERGATGATVVRLKGGDPFVFGRGGEEAEALAAAGIPFEVVPGITSAIGAAAYAGIPVTHRGVSTHFTVVTGHEDPAKGRTDVDWEALARAGGTLVILMGAGNIDEIAQRLVAGGRSASTPVAAVRNGTRPDQRTVRATLATIADVNVKAPSAIVVGDVAAPQPRVVREPAPLRAFGRRHPRREQASELRSRLELLGADVIELPAIAIEPVDVTLPELSGYDWLVFTSANGVDAFFERGLATRRPRRARARGRAGGRDRAGYRARGGRARSRPRPRARPRRRRGAPRRLPEARRPGAAVLIARAEQARDVLPDGLAELGYTVDILPVYRTVRAEPDAAAVTRIREGRVDAITFTSSSTVTNLCDLLGAVPDPQPLVVSIGPVTSETARAQGLTVHAEADPHTIDGLVDALVATLQR